MNKVTLILLFFYAHIADAYIWHDNYTFAFYGSAEEVCSVFASQKPPEITLKETRIDHSGSRPSASCIFERCLPSQPCVEQNSNVALTIADEFALGLPNYDDTSSCSLAGNPINPSSGSKVQHEPLISLGGLSPIIFDLYYNSSRLDKWRHSFSRSIHINSQRATPRYDFNGYPFGIDPIAVPESPGYFSGSEKSGAYGSSVNMSMTTWYSTPDDACTLGWGEYKGHVNYYWESTSSASYAGNGHCEIFDTSETPPELKMTISVYSKYAGQSLEQMSDSSTVTLRLTRQDGKIIVFKHESGIWQNKSYTGERIESIYDINNIITGYRFITENDDIEEYDEKGILKSISSVNGYNKRLEYVEDSITGNTLLEKVYNISGNGEVTASLSFEYEVYGDEDQYNRIKLITDNTGRSWVFDYGVNENLHSIGHPDGETREYHYENPDLPYHLTGITDEQGHRYATWGYNKSKKAILSAHGSNADIEKVIVDYTPGRSTVTKIRGSQVSQAIKSIVSVHAAQISGAAAVSANISGHGAIDYEFDSLTGYIDAVDNKGLRTEYLDRDSKGNPAIVREAAGTSEQRETSHTYDPRYHSKVSTVTEPSVYPGNTKVTTNQYDDFGNKISVSIDGFEPDGSAVTRTTTFEYKGPYHQLTQIDGPRTDVSDIYTIDYYADDATEGNNRARMKRVTAPLGITLYDNITYTPTGKIKTFVDTNDVQSALSYYYGNDRLQSLSQLDLNAAQARLTEWTYLATGEVATITTGNDPVDKTTLTLNYDDARRLTSIIDGLGNIIEYVLDSEGNVEQENIWDNGGVLKKQLTQTFDDYNRLQLRTQVNEAYTETWLPNGTLDKTVDGKNVTTDYSYDNLRRLTQVNLDMGGTSPQTANALTILNFDVQDNLTYVKNPVNGETVYSYDDLGNQLSRDSDDTGLTTYSHDDAGNITSMLDANGETINYSYDALNRLITTTSSNAADDYLYEYDNCQNGAMRLCKVSNNNSAQFYQYDAFGNVASQQALQYTYDTANRLETINYPSGAIVRYDYDAAGQVLQVSLERNGSSIPLASNINYEAFGDITNLLYGNALTLTQSRDSAYRPLTQSILSVFGLNYTQYDANGNLTQRDDPIAGSNSIFGYDAHNRLNAASGDFGVRSYEYDKNANRTKLANDAASITSSYDPASNRLSMRGVDNAVLDNNGNMLSLDARVYSYTKRNRLFEVYDGGVLKASYQYNGLGQRISKTLPDDTGKYFIYDTDRKLMVETDISGNILFEYIYLNGQLLAKYTPDSDIDGVSNFEEYQQGTNPVMVDSDGDGLKDIDEVFIYGTAISNADSDGDGVSDSQELAFNSDPLNGNITIGDINLDGQLNLGDYVLLSQYVLNIRIPTPTEQVQADANQDGVLNVQDILLMQRVLLGSKVSWSDISIDNIERLFARIYQGIIPAAYAANGDGEIFYVHNDHLGAPIKMTNEMGVVVWQAVYDPFGKASVNEDVDGDGNTVEMNIRFPGQYYDVETGLHYNYYRTYDPELGRYITSDPIGLFGGVNTFGYVGGNPVNWVDPSGRNTYVINRTLGGNTSTSQSNPFSHTYTATTDSKGKVINTYSWGNAYTDGKTGWTLNNLDDMKAAQEAIDKGEALEIYNNLLDPYVQAAFDELKQDPKEPWALWDNCKHKTGDLLGSAINKMSCGCP